MNEHNVDTANIEYGNSTNTNTNTNTTHVTSRFSYNGLGNICNYIVLMIQSHIYPILSIIYQVQPEECGNVCMRVLYEPLMKLLLTIHNSSTSTNDIHLNNLFQCAIPTTFYYCYTVLHTYMNNIQSLYTQLEPSGRSLYKHELYKEYNKWNTNIYYQVLYIYVKVFIYI